jgi:hypothetical protein
MRIPYLAFAVCLALAAPLLPAQAARPPQLQLKAEQLFALANQARQAAGAGPLRWDPALAAAALQHCQRMAAEGPIAHRYGGELDLAGRAAQAGAHFSLIEENIAVGSYPESIHQGWMNSPDHRANLLNPAVDRVGIAVVESGGVFYAVSDYERAVPVLTQPQVESAVAGLIRVSGVTILRDPAAARAACQANQGLPRSLPGPQPLFVMRWQDSDLHHLPQALVDRLASSDYRQAAVGSCPPQGVEGAFTTFRVAVLLYGAPSSNDMKPFYY